MMDCSVLVEPPYHDFLDVDIFGVGFGLELIRWCCRGNVQCIAINSCAIIVNYVGKVAYLIKDDDSAVVDDDSIVVVKSTCNVEGTSVRDSVIIFCIAHCESLEIVVDDGSIIE